MPDSSTSSQFYLSLARRLQNNLLLLISILLTLALWIILFFEIPLFQKLPNWFWPLRTFHAPNYAWIVPILILNFSVLILVNKFPQAVTRNLILIIVAGYATQHMFALVEGRGLDGIRDRAVITGHADFVYDAADPPSIGRTLRNYRDMIATEELQSYPHSTKPPGHFLVYLLSSRITRSIPWGTQDSFIRLSTFIAFSYPLLTYIPIIPLFVLARLYLPRVQAYLLLFLFVSAPNVNLITLHLDQCLYPLFFILPLSLYLYGRRFSQPLLLLLAGISVAVALFVSYSLISVISCIVLIALLSIRIEGGAFAQSAQREMKNLLVVGIGFLGFELILYGLFRYNLVYDYLYVMSRHQTWKVSTWTPTTTLSVGVLDLLEYTLWIGFPLSLFSASWMVKSLRKWRENGACILALSILVILVIMAFFGKTVAETGRLWIFLLPCLVLFATHDLVERYPASYKSVFSIILAMQLFSTFFIKLFQDFY